MKLSFLDFVLFITIYVLMVQTCPLTLSPFSVLIQHLFHQQIFLREHLQAPARPLSVPLCPSHTSCLLAGNYDVGGENALKTVVCIMDRLGHEFTSSHIHKHKHLQKSHDQALKVLRPFCRPKF